MTEFIQNLLHGIFAKFDYLVHILWLNPYLHPISIDITNKGITTMWMVSFLILVAVLNQVKNFAPDSKTRPLPYKYKTLLNLILPIRFLPSVLTTYWTVLSVMSIYNYMYINNFTNWKACVVALFLYIILYILLLIFTFNRAEYTPFLRAYLDQTLIKRLNEISTEYQLKNSGRVIYTPEGTPRITKDYEVMGYFKDGKLFHGLDAKEKPVYTDFQKSMDGHFTVIGGTGAGKGVLTRIYLAQMIKEDITSFIFDPKPDNYMYEACVHFAKQNSKKIHVIDLDTEFPQISLFKDVTKLEFRNIFIRFAVKPLPSGGGCKAICEANQ